MKPKAEPKGREEQKQSSQSTLFKPAAGSRLGGAPQLVAEAAEASTRREDGGGTTLFFSFPFFLFSFLCCAVVAFAFFFVVFGVSCSVVVADGQQCSILSICSCIVQKTGLWTRSRGVQ